MLEEIYALDDKLNIPKYLFTSYDSAGVKRYSLYISKKLKPEEVNLLYWENCYALIIHLSRLFADDRKYIF